MATYKKMFTRALPAVNNTDRISADYAKSIVNHYMTEFVAAGMVKTSDTGQLDPTTITVSSTSGITAIGYTMYKIWDNKPYILKVFWSIVIGIVGGSGASDNGLEIKLHFGVGSASDGAGNLTGNVKSISTGAFYSSTALGDAPFGMPAGFLVKSYIYKSDSCFWFYGAANAFCSTSAYARPAGLIHITLNTDFNGNTIGDLVSIGQYNLTYFSNTTYADTNRSNPFKTFNATNGNIGSDVSNMSISWTTEEIDSAFNVTCLAISNPFVDGKGFVNQGVITVPSAHFSDLQEFDLNYPNGTKKKFVAFVGDNIPFKFNTSRTNLKPAFIWE